MTSVGFDNPLTFCPLIIGAMERRYTNIAQRPSVVRISTILPL
jgi:hypothetical protein